MARGSARPPTPADLVLHVRGQGGPKLRERRCWGARVGRLTGRPRPFATPLLLPTQLPLLPPWALLRPALLTLLPPRPLLLLLPLLPFSRAVLPTRALPLLAWRTLLLLLLLREPL